jgi:DNA-binding winged helix-turn-helix (wHTH) protein
MVYPPYAAPFPDASSAPHTLGNQQRAMLTLMAQKPGRLVTREELAAKLGLPQLTPRRAETLVDGINDVLGPDTIATVPRRGWMLTRYPDTPATINL